MPRILIWDIETAPMVATAWGLWKQNLSHENILRDWYIISGAWKWHGERGVHHVAIEPSEAKDYLAGDGPAPDARVVNTLREVVGEADIIVAHNGDSFDLKKLNARLIHHGLPALPPVRTVDTLKESRKIAKFSSNRLDYLTRELVGGGKIKTTYDLWLKVMHGDERALARMIRYNRRDVTQLEILYDFLRPYMKAHPNVALTDGGVPRAQVCPRCGSGNVHKRGTAKTQTRVYQRFQCQDCGSWSRDSRVGGGGVLK